MSTFKAVKGSTREYLDRSGAEGKDKNKRKKIKRGIIGEGKERT